MSEGASTVFAGGESINLSTVNPIDGASAFSFSVWLTNTDLTDKRYWLGRDYDSSITVGFDGTSTFVHFEVQVTGTGGHFIRQSTAQAATFMSNNTWTHLAYAYNYNGGTEVHAMYVNGTSIANQYRSWTNPVSAIATGTGDFGIGDTPLSSTYDYSGNIAWLTIYDSYLSQNQIIDSMYNPMALPANPAGEWDCLTLSPRDLSGNGFNGTNNGAALDTDGPPVHLF